MSNLQNKVRQAAYERDRYTCRDCGCVGIPGMKEGNINVHHIIPSKLGGLHTLENLITLCVPCHRRQDHDYHLERILAGAIRNQGKRKLWNTRKRLAVERYQKTALVFGIDAPQTLRVRKRGMTEGEGDANAAH